jgi:RNA exonuclease 4
MVSQRINTTLLSTYNISKKILERESNGDEETTSLTSTSSLSDSQTIPRCDEKRTRQRRGLRKGTRKNPTNGNDRRGKEISKESYLHPKDVPTRKTVPHCNEKRARRRRDLPKGTRKNNCKMYTRGKWTSNATSIKPFDAPMQKRDMYFALDCEMVGVGPGGLDSALARISMINWDNELVLDTYVRVQEKVTDYRTFVSGIRQEYIESNSAMTLEEVQDTVSKMLRGKILIGHGLENDLKAIGISHPRCDIRDTTAYQPYMRQTQIRKGESPVFCPRKLRDLAWEELGAQIQVMGKAHCPIEDATATMNLYKVARMNWEMSLMKQVYSSPNLQGIVGAYHQSTDRLPTTEERLAAVRVAQQQARTRASAALRCQTTMKSYLQ